MSERQPSLAVADLAEALGSRADCERVARRLAEQHLADCEAAYWAAEEGEEVASPACAPYCSCPTCTVREVLYAAWPIVEAYVRAARCAGSDSSPKTGSA